MPGPVLSYSVGKLNFHPLELTAETEIELFFLSRLRDEIKFSSSDALREQIGNDIRKAGRYLTRIERRPIQAGI